MKRLNVFVYESVNCNRRKLDAKRIADYFTKNGYKIINNPKNADFIILSTCAYSNERSDYSLKMVEKFKKYDAELIVTGCLPVIDAEELKEIFNGQTVNTYNLDKIDEIFTNNDVKFHDAEDSNILWENQDDKLAKKIYDNFICRNPSYKYIKGFRKDAFFIRPAWGCLGNCSYCAIKKAIGPLKSKPISTCIKEFKKGLNRGYKKFIFDADDLGAYGFDINSNYSKMLDAITSTPGEYEIHIRYIHPRWLVKYIDEFEDVIKKGKIQSIGCSIQSGNSRILKLMSRYPDTKRIKDTLIKLKAIKPDLTLETECINGFPTETKEEFLDTLKLINDIHFEWGTIFPYSCKSGTKAEHLKPKVSGEKLINRMKLAKKYLKKSGYNAKYIKKSNILIFSSS